MVAAAFAVFGLIFGSFLTVLIARLPRHESVVTGRSRCPRCGAEIGARDNVPLLSWLFLRGRCRRCGEPISAEYPLTEAATAALFAAAGLLVRPVYAAALTAAFLGLLLAVAVIDARHRIVPNAITYPSVLLFAGAIGAGQALGGGVDLVRAAIGLAAYAVPLLLLALAAPRGMGMGDVKLAALIGLVLGARDLALVGVAAGIGILAGGVGALVGVAVFRLGRKSQLPFGPFLAGGAAVAALVGRPIADWYLALFG